jgi:ABC-type sugar transport system ATPase subunit
MDATDTLLAMRGVRKRFAAGEVLHGVDFTLARGQIHALVGQNGAGKSTLMKVLGGVYPDYTGSVVIDGREVELSSPHAALDAGVAVIYQEFSLVPGLTVAENIALGREPRGRARGLIARRRLRERSAAEAEAQGISLPMDQPVGALGVADQQLTEIVKALSRDARILVMDEPTARLSPGERDRLFDAMRRLRERGVGIVYISHFLEEVFAVADVVTVLRDGNLVSSHPTSELDLGRLASLMVGREVARLSRVEDEAREVEAPALELVGVSVIGRPPISLAVLPGEVIGIAGLVGSGRTRLARAIVGAAPRTGTIRVHGREIDPRSPRDAARSGLVMLPEDRRRDGLVLPSSILRNVSLTALGLSLTRLGMVRRGARSRLVREQIARLRITPSNPERTVATLSGGNQQKVLMARAFGAGARVLILDQPTAGVDVGAKAELYEHIRAVTREGLAVTLISDDLDELLLLSSRILIMHDGRAVAVLPAGSIDRETLLAVTTTGVLKEAA